ncbi:MAG: VIT1/CCC1 transporter family protein [Acidimicrobiia bacterium]|nr:VIT1/CCC1 transporter family protein [Acidimicrobiia bacterium]
MSGNSRHVHVHRDVQGGTARAAIFGVSDGLVSNVALILGVAGATTDASFVRVAGLSGLIAGAISMAAGEYLSMRAQNELIEREVERERRSIEENPVQETQELVSIYEERGLPTEQATQVAEQVMADPDVALDVHTREEMGVNPSEIGRPLAASIASFFSFAAGAVLPLVPWFLTDGAVAVWSSVILGLIAAAIIGAILARFTGRSRLLTAGRQVVLAGFACAATYIIGSLAGTSV